MASRRTVCILLGLVALVVSGCAPRVELTPQVATSLVELRHELVGGKTQVEATMASLADLARNPRLNTERQIEFFHKEMKSLEEQADRIRDVNTRVQAHTNEYFQAWNKELNEIRNPQVASAGQAREARSREVLETIRTRLNETKQVVSPFMSNLRDINRYLQRDETAQAVEALMPVIRETQNDRSRIIRSLDEVIAAIDRATSSVP